MVYYLRQLAGRVRLTTYLYWGTHNEQGSYFSMKLLPSIHVSIKDDNAFLFVEHKALFICFEWLFFVAALWITPITDKDELEREIRLFNYDKD